MRRAFLLAALAVIALPAYAHGEQVIYYFLFVLYGIPALLLIFVPWGSVRAKVVAVLALALCVAIAWQVALVGDGLPPEFPYWPLIAPAIVVVVARLRRRR